MLEVGDFVVAIGNPFGLGQTVTTGVVSALVNLHGELVGIGFAIPVNMTKTSMQQILEHGEVERGQIGVMVQDITPDLREAFDLEPGLQGVLVASVTENSPAQAAGLKSGDIILEVNGKSVQSVGQLRTQIGIRRIGEKVTLKIFRDGNNKLVEVAVGKPPAMAMSDDKIHDLLAGATFADNPEGPGVVVISIEPGSRAAYSGLRPQDISDSVNKQRTDDIDSFRSAIKQSKSSILLHIYRDSGSLYLVIK